jgi:hypothetical protein
MLRRPLISDLSELNSGIDLAFPIVHNYTEHSVLGTEAE